ncbi:DNRLRE domain-containing protein [Paenibacillus sp. YN15]|uniref:CBM96 family carbohydrate-binding protein n=1 Tax=Paenibacillus sp. YN15 TaxID=1742774 RepID=UPI0015EC1690|nr:DNRLRE domain-containing protein [Paenibacillus sp. YN15]
MKRRISSMLVWIMLLGMVLPVFASTGYANEGGVGQTIVESVYQNVYNAEKQVKLHPVADAHIHRNSPDTNFGTSELLTIRWQNSSASADTRNAYLKFDLAGLDRLEDHTILGAKVRLYMYDTTVPPYMVVRRVGSEWTDTSLTWAGIISEGNNAPADGNANASAPDSIRVNVDLTKTISQGQVGKWIEFDLKPQYIKDFNEGKHIFAIELTEHSTAAGIVNFSSREGEFPPELILDVEGPELAAVSITSPPAKTTYSVGESLDLAGLAVNGHYADGVSLPLTNYAISGFDSSVAVGDQIITVTAEGKTASFPVRIVAVKDTRLTAIADSFIQQGSPTGNWGSGNYMTLKKDDYSTTNRKIYLKYDLSGINVTEPEAVIKAVVLLHRSNGGQGGVGIHSVSDSTWKESELSWSNAPEYSGAPLSIAAVGEENKYYEFDVTDYVKTQLSADFLSFAFVGQNHNVTINFDSREVSEKEPVLVLTAAEPKLDSIEIVSPPSQTLYYVGQELDLTGLIVKGNYENGTSLVLTDYTVSGFDSSAATPAQTITVQAAGKTAAFTVEIQSSSGVNPPVWPAGSGLAASPTSKTKTFLSWTPAKDNGKITGYRLWSGDELVAALDGETLSYAVRGLTPETHYTFRVEAGDNEGNWTGGPEVSVYTLLVSPTLPQVISIESGQFNMDDWTVKINTPSAPGQSGPAVWEIVDGNLKLTTYSGNGSPPLRNVIVHETPFIGDFTWTGKVSVTPRGDWDDLAVVFNYVDEANYNFVSLNKSNDDNTHGIFSVANNSLMQLADFELGIMTSGAVHDLRIDRTGSLIQVYLDGDVIGQASEGRYTTGRFGYGSANDRVTLSEMKVYGRELIDIAPPSPPGQLAAWAQSSTAIRLAWEASTDDSGVKAYSIYRDGALLAVTNLTSYVDENLLPLTAYSYYVVAHDVADKDSEPSAIVNVTTLERDPYLFPFSHSSIDAALKEPLLQFTLGTEWAWYSKRSGAALMHLMTAALYDAYYEGSDGTVVKDRILAHIRHMLVPNSGREPGASGSLDTAGTAMAIQAFDVASTIPAVWNELTEAEKHKITLIMQAHLVAAHWGHDDENNYNTGINQGGNFNKGWNPNFIEGAIGIALATARYLGGAEASNAFLRNFNYNDFMSQLQAAGLSSIAWTFNATGRIGLEASIKNASGQFNGFTFKGYTLDQPFEWVKARALIMYNKPVKAEVYDGGTRRGYIANNPEGLPNIGVMGMAQEFDSIDGNSLRTDLGYAADGWNNSLISLLTAYYYGTTGPAADMELIETRYRIGSTDLIYKAANGYYGYAKGSALPLRNEVTIDANMGYYWLKDLWENVVSQPELVPQRDTTPPTAPGNVTGQLAGESIRLDWEASTDNNRVAGYRIYLNGQEIAQTRTAIPQYVAQGPFAAADAYTVKAYDAVGNVSAASEAAVIDGEPVVVNTPPVWPAGSALTAASTTQTGTVLSWTAAMDDAEVTAYKLYKDGVLLDTVTGAVGSYTVAGLAAGTTYTFKVEAGDASGQWTSDGPQAQATTLRPQGGGSDGGTAPPPAKPKAVAASGEASIELEVAVDKNKGTAAAKLEAKTLEQFLKNHAGSSQLNISMPLLEEVSSYVLQMPDLRLKEGDSGYGLLLDTPYGSVVLTNSLLRELAGAGGQQADIAVAVSQGDKSGLAPDVRKALGDRPLIQVGISANGKSVKVGGEAGVVVAIPYNPTKEELARHEHLVIWAINESGAVQPVPSGKYDPAAGAVTFTAAGFSQYGIAFVEKTFKDMAEAEWSRRAVEVLASRGIINGTVTISGGAKIKNVRGVAFAGLVADQIKLEGCDRSALAWTKVTHWLAGYGLAGQTTSLMEFSEVVMPNSLVLDGDASDFYSVASGPIEGWRFDGIYIAPHFYNAASTPKPHTDSLQFAGSAAYSNMTFRDAALFASNNCAIQVGSLNGLTLDHSYIAAGSAARSRYPFLSGGATDGGTAAFNGSGSSFIAIDSVIIGALGSSSWASVTNTRINYQATQTPATGSWTVDLTLSATNPPMPPMPDDAYLNSIWGE